MDKEKDFIEFLKTQLRETKKLKEELEFKITEIQGKLVIEGVCPNCSSQMKETTFPDSIYIFSDCECGFQWHWLKEDRT